MKKIFGKLELTWKKIIIAAIVIGITVGLLNTVPSLLDTSFRDPAIYFDFWILLGILIIINSKSNKDSALKCFVFFLISQPLIYLVEVPFVSQGWGIFVYYKYWFIWTLICLPMGYIGYYIKKNKWWGLLILLPMMIIIMNESTAFLGGLIYSFPHHLLSCLFCYATLIIYPLYLFNNKKIKNVGLTIAIILIIFSVIITVLNKNTREYSTDILCDSEEHPVKKGAKVGIEDEKFGELSIKKYVIGDGENKDSFYCVHAKFVKTGKTTFTLKNPNEEKKSV